MNTNTKEEPEPSVGAESGGYELAEAVTGLCRGTLYAMVHDRRIPHVRLSARLVRFRRADLNRWMEEHSVGVEGAQRLRARR